jgi:hypothetical protein
MWRRVNIFNKNEKKGRTVGTQVHIIKKNFDFFLEPLTLSEFTFGYVENSRTVRTG